MSSSTAAPLPPDAVPGRNRHGSEGPAWRIPRNVTENVSIWIEWLDELLGRIKSRDEAAPQPEPTKGGGSTEHLGADDGTRVHAAASGVEDAGRPPLSKAGPPSTDQQSPSSSSMLPIVGRQADGALVVRAKADAAAGRTASIRTGDVATKHRTRGSVTVYYDRYLQSFFEELVKSVLASRSILRKANKAKARAALIGQGARLITESDEDENAGQASKDSAKYPRRFDYTCTGPTQSPGDQQPDLYDKLDKGFETVQSEVEAAAHRFLRGEGCGADVETIRGGLQEIQELASEEMGNMDGEGAGVTGSGRPRGSGQQAQTMSRGTASVWDPNGVGWQPPNPLLMDGDVAYYIGKKRAEGSFGIVFEGTRTEGSGESRPVAIKFERQKTDTPQLRDEYRAYKQLAGCPGVPNMYYFGPLRFHHILILDLLGPSLEDLFHSCGGRFSVQTVAMLADQMLSMVQSVHEMSMIYRDIKPDNFLMDGRTVSLVDFGMAKAYRHPQTKQHIPYREGRSLCGTTRYISINTHLKREQSRRDDLEALGHVFMYFLRGRLPWQGIEGVSKERKNEMIGRRKETTPIAELCKGFPVQFERYLTYVRGLDFEATPDYDYLRGLFAQALKDVGGVEDGGYDWVKIGKGKVRERASQEAVPRPSEPTSSTTPRPPLEGQSRRPAADADGRVRKRSGTDSIPNLRRDRFRIRQRASGLGAPSAGWQAEGESSIVKADGDSSHEKQNGPRQAIQQHQGIGQYPVLRKPPPLDDAWVQYERDAGPQPTYRSILEKQSEYPEECRELHRKMMAPGARDFHLSEGVTTRQFTMASRRDGFLIPVHQYRLVHGDSSGDLHETVAVYYHGGGLKIGEADSEDLSCRRIVKESGLGNLTLYSIGYRLMPQVEAAVCLSDSLDAFHHLRHLHRHAKFLVVGSSSGGQLAALVSQTATRGDVDGVLLRCPVTSDAFNGPQYVPEWLRPLHTTARTTEFETSLLGVMKREIPRDGLERMPLETARDDLRGQPRHWIQVCTNDMLYSDGTCYAEALKDAGVEVQVDVVEGYPHTFWLRAPLLPRALDADHAMIKGLRWLLEGMY